MKMTSQMDAGPVFVQEKIRLVANETASSLHYRLILLANMILEKYLFLIISGKITPEIQNERLVSFGLNIKRNNEKII
jgi:methionyl-tRNA formyltransferase